MDASRVATSIGRDGAAYRRGMVLGLTMAEIMLLLVFCLLIAAAVIFKHEKETRLAQVRLTETAQAEAKRVEEEAKRLRDENEQLLKVVRTVEAQPKATARTDEEWKRLTRSAAVVEKLEKAGLDPETLVEKAEDIRVAEKLIGDGRTGSEIVEAVVREEDMWKRLDANPELGKKDAAEIVRLAAAGLEAEKKAEGEHDWPPIISLSEAKGYSFAVGQATLSSDFEKLISSDIADKVASTVDRYKATVVEIIGHTDEQPLSSRRSNLDARLMPAFGGKAEIGSLVPGDNAGLGMARAVSVASRLRRDARFASVSILPLSGGQMIAPGDTVSDGSAPGDARERRRIEIRVRRPDMLVAP